MKSLLKYLGKYKKESFFAPLFKMLEATFELFVPLVMAAIIDIGIVNQDKNYIFKMCGIMIALGFIGLLCSITAQYFSAKAATGFAKELKNALFKKMQKLTFSEIDKIGTATMINRISTDVNQVQTGVNLVLRLFLRSPFIVFGAMVMAFTIDVKSAITFVVVIPVLSVVVFAIMLMGIPLYKIVQKQLDFVLIKVRENLTGVRVIRAFGKEIQETWEFEARNNALTRMQLYVGKISSLMNPLTYIIINVGIVVLIYIGALRVDYGILTQGAVVALYNYMSQILVELIKLANLIINITKSLASAQRIEKVFEMESEPDSERDIYVEEKLAEDALHISLKNVSFTYEGAQEAALKNISFEIKKGETVGIIGGTGSGKTTLAHLIPGYYTATEGDVYVNGKNVKEYDLEILRDKFGMVMQKAVLFKGTIRQNLLWGNPKATDEQLIDAITAAQGIDIIHKKENGLDEMVEQNGRNFSGGQRQRLSIARALVRKPEILIFDDSASALDYATDAAFRKSISKLSYNPTKIIISQRTTSIMSADKIIVMEDGCVESIGTHEELLKISPVYKEIYDSQFQSEGAVYE